MRTSSAGRAALLALGFIALTTISAFAGAPLKGVDVKLGKNPGGGLASRLTGADGQFDFGVLPKGSYQVTFTRVAGQPDIELIVLSAGQRKSVVFAAPAAATARKSGAVIAADFLVVNSDGVHPITGSVATAD
jgi:hypothetical protein